MLKVRPLTRSQDLPVLRQSIYLVSAVVTTSENQQYSTESLSLLDSDGKSVCNLSVISMITTVGALCIIHIIDPQKDQDD
jgi:hypothetical protein